MGGLMSVTGLPGQGPVRAGIAVNDLVAGTILAFGIATALYEREHTGVGRWVHTSLLETQVFLMDFQAARYLMKGDVAGQAGNEHPTMIPSNAFPTADGAVNISATAPHHWIKFCEAIGKAEWAAKPEWSSQEARRKDRPAVYAAIGEVTRQKPTAHWVDLFESIGIPAGPINKIDQVFAEPQVQHLNIATGMKSSVFGETKVVASPLNVAGAQRNIRLPTPETGQHTAEVMQWLGYSDAEIGKLRTDGVV
jgi:formyl-CoA transferase